MSVKQKMKTLLALMVVAVAAVLADNSPVSYLNLYGSFNRKVKPVNVQFTGISFFDNFLKSLPKNSEISVNEVVVGPTYVLIRSTQEPGLTQYFAAKGLESILTDPSMKYARDYLLSPGEKAGFIFRANNISDESLLELPVTEVYLPSQFKVGDLFKVLVGNVQIPIILLADKNYIESLHLKSLDSLGRIRIMPVEGDFKRIN